MDSQSVPTTPANQNSTGPNSDKIAGVGMNRLKNLSRKQRYLFSGIILLILVVVIGLFIYSRQNEADKAASVVIAKVGDTPIPQRYLDLELNYYPGTPSTTVKQALTQKIVDDEVTLQAAKQEGIIKTASNPSSGATSEEYLARTKQVQIIRETIDQRATDIEAEVVSIWFYNNGYVGPMGYDKGKELALKKITALYDRVKKKEITVKQAGELIASDKELIDSRMNTSLKENSYILLRGKKDAQLSFWPEYDKQLWQLNPGELTQVFTGTDNVNGKTMPILYAFGQVTRKTSQEGVANYDQWLAVNKGKYEIKY